MTRRFQSSLVEVGTSFGWLLFDLQQKQIVRPLCDYADAMVTVDLARLTVSQEMGYLRVFWSFLQSSGPASAEDVTDSTLRKFREWAFDQVVRGAAHRGSLDAAKATVNAKLRRVYDWLRWMEDSGRARRGLIGPTGCQVTSGLQGSSADPRRRNRIEAEAAAWYPLQFRLKAGKSKHRLAKFVPTEATLDSVHAFFHSTAVSAHVAHRNCMIASIASYSGFRRASIQSLTVTQFTGSDFETTDRDSVIVLPRRQKFGYGDTFEIPLWLHDHVKWFIEECRSPLIKRLNVGERIHQDKVFISDRDAKPLTDGAMTALMSKALRAMGAGKGAAMHAWRAKFAVEENAEGYAQRRELGLDTSIATMDEVLARKLGHKNPRSARPYTSVSVR